MKIKEWLPPAVLAALLVACGSAAEQTGFQGVVVPVEGGAGYVDILPSELDRMLADKDFAFVNVHVPYEGEIPETDLHLAFDSISQHLDQLPAPEDKIVLYCRSGSMSAIAARELAGLGYSQIYNLDGGFRAWIQAGFPFNE